ncbi:MAG: H-type lectin domain-containing protein [Magnetococcus sp. DMHC-8]
MKTFFIILLLLLGGLIIVAVQTWEGTGLLPVLPSSPDRPAMVDGERDRWLDARLAPLAERVAILEERLQRLVQPADPLPGLAELESRLDRLTSRPVRLENGTVVVRKGDADWKLTDLFARVRQYRQRIAFAHPFAQTPKVMLGITLLDLPGDKIRLQTRPEEMDAQGFTLVLETRSDVRLEEIQVDWLAFGVGKTEGP